MSLYARVYRWFDLTWAAATIGWSQFKLVKRLLLAGGRIEETENGFLVTLAAKKEEA